MSVKILLFVRNFWPELTGTGLYAGDLADWLHANGHDVTVVTTPAHYPGWSVLKAERVRFWRRDTRKPYPILRCPIFVPRMLNGHGRMLHALSFALSASPALLVETLRRKPDVIATVMPTLAGAPSVTIMAALTGARSWFHIQDLEVDAAFELNLLKDSWQRIAYGLERIILRTFDLVTTITPAMKKRLEEKELKGKTIPVIPNWIDKNRIFPLTSPSTFRRDNQIPDDQTLVLYSGSLVGKQGLEVIIEAARRLKNDEGIYFLICGDGPLKDSLKEAANGLPRIHFLPLQPAHKLNDMLNAADIHLLAQAPGASDLVMPSKLGPMMASGRPVVAAVEPGGAIARMIEGAGIAVPPNDDASFANAIRELATDPNRRQALGITGRLTAIRELDRDNVMARTERLLLALTRQPPGNPEIDEVTENPS